MSTSTTNSFTSFSEKWKIDSLGECKYPSPLEAVAFVDPTEKILLDVSATDFVTSPTAASPTTANNAGSVCAALDKAGAREKIFFDPPKVTVGIVTCGGLCPGLNNVIRSIVNICTYRYKVKKVLGFKYGYEGLVPGLSSVVELTPQTVQDIHVFGGTLLGSSRGPQNIGVMVDYLVSLGVDILFTIGGDGTQRGSQAIAQECLKRKLKISVVGIPKTIDNDIAFVEKCFGFETAVQMAQASIVAAHEEARSARNGIGIVKLMGRESGFIALNASLASGDVNILLLPECKFSLDTLISHIHTRLQTRSHILIVVAEGAGQELCAPAGGLGKDISGNPVFIDIGTFLKNEITARLKKLGVSHTLKFIDPSYSIRSAACVASDATYTLRLGHMAVHAGMAGYTNLLVGMMHNEFVHLPIGRAVEGRKKVDVRGGEMQAFLDASGMSLDLVFGDKVGEGKL
ncbi:hypothetical protein HDV05_005705 [Chytridiales sp. JEL 0842]|nr:hypothetical protein HDV05_005705 [Chytridiales sp. JEL 0842]